MKTVAHEITIETDFLEDGYAVKCSCGYESLKQSTESAAVELGREHQAKAKG